jgi:hypothetical protein
MVILRCIGPEQFFLERVVFPFELLSFECPSHSEVEIWSHSLGGPEMVESFPSRELVLESDSPLAESGPIELLVDPQAPWAAAS